MKSQFRNALNILHFTYQQKHFNPVTIEDASGSWQLSMDGQGKYVCKKCNKSFVTEKTEEAHAATYRTL